MTDAPGSIPHPTFRGPAFKKLHAPTKTAITTKVDTQLLEQIREFCHVNSITFASFVEVALADELQKQLSETADSSFVEAGLRMALEATKEPITNEEQ